MTKLARRSDLWLVAPGIVALGAALAFRLVSPDPILHVSGPVWAWLAGLAGFLCVAAGLWWRHRLTTRCAAMRADEVRAAAVAQAWEQSQVTAEVERARLLGRLDHELKNPLTALRISLSTATQADPATLGTALRTASSQTDRLSTLMSDLRKVTEMRHRPLDIERVNVADLLDDVRRVVEDAHPREAAEREWSVTVPTAPWPLPTVSADPGLLFLAVHNLVENALKYSRPNDRVELRGLEDAQGNVVIEVADTGLGIPEGEHALVWEELARSASVARSVPGSGLGLPLVAVIVARHGGRVGLRSRSETGTVFRITLPVDGPRR